jgi:hypothetical protein
VNCIFGYFDVLGFTSFCENCDSRSAERVLKMIDDFDAEIPEVLLHGLDTKDDTPQVKIDLLKGRLKWLIFSDTIFVAMPFDRSEHSGTLKFNLIFFTVLAAYINRKMFENGLPVRGTVDVGDVIISKRCFAGKAVIEAHNLSKNCQVAATVVSDQAHNLLLEVLSGNNNGFRDMYDDLIVERDIATKTERLPNSSLWGPSSEKMKTLCWFFLEMGRIKPFAIPSDLNAYVHGKFTALGKKLSGEKAMMKVFNTASLFQDWKAASNGRLRSHVSITARANGTLSTP